MQLNIEINQHNLQFHRPYDLETIWDQMDQDDFGSDERIPYWTEIWPASILLGKWLFRKYKQIAGKWCLDLGCGLGLTSCAASICSAKTIGLDYEWLALYYARQNARLNQSLHASWVQMDWRQPGFKPGMFSYIWGADIIYENRFFKPLHQLFQHALAPKGKIWLTSPEREVSRPFWEMMRQNHWQITLKTKETITFGGCTDMCIYLWEMHRQRGKP